MSIKKLKGKEELVYSSTLRKKIESLIYTALLDGMAPYRIVQVLQEIARNCEHKEWTSGNKLRGHIIIESFTCTSFSDMLIAYQCCMNL